MNQIFSSRTQMSPLLKVCGITSKADSEMLIAHKVEALGFNFWSQSKRYITPEDAGAFANGLKGKILRVGVFVNETQENVLQLFADDVIDVAQFHGDESIEYCQNFAAHGYPFIKAIGVANADSLDSIGEYGADAILLDAHAPLVYGGTGDTFDWDLANELKRQNPDLAIILAGGITAENAGKAAEQVAPVMLDVASGAEISPGVKDLTKITAIQAAIVSASAKLA